MLLTLCFAQEQQALYGNATGLWVVVGAASEDLRYLKSISLQLWLFGYELPGKQRLLTTGAALLLCRSWRKGCSLNPGARKQTCSCGKPSEPHMDF